VSVLEDPREEDKEDVYSRSGRKSREGSSFGRQDDDANHEVVQKATSVRIEKLQSMMRSKHDMYQVLHAMRKP
jgi:hypothetical protein